MNITAQIIQDFRDYYPEFDSTTDWTEAYLTRVLEEADDETGARWGVYESRSLKKRGMFAYAAHKAVLAKVVTNVVGSGGIAPAASQVASKSVGDESVSYSVSTPAGLEANQLGDLRTTAYGVEFLRLRARAGMGPLVV